MKNLSIITVVCIIFLLGSGCARNGNSEKQEEPVTIDINLTTFSRTMAHSTVNDMMINPEIHLGKTVRARGIYTTMYFDPEHLYNFLIVEGPPGCCPQGLMFIWYDDHGYEYPQIGTRIEITGTFKNYQGFDFPYNYLSISDISIVN